MITCKKCKAEKPADQMKPRNGAPSKVCIDCDEAAKKERARLKKVLSDARAESVKSRKKRKKSTTPKPAKQVVEQEINEVTIAPGLGCKAWLTEDDRLQISQRNDGAPADNVVLSKTEAKVIFAQFHDWVAQPEPS